MACLDLNRQTLDIMDTSVDAEMVREGKMSTASLEDRVAALELRFAELLSLVQDRPPQGAWRKVVGMFADDPQIEALHRETCRIREQDRSAARSQDAS
jgi:hypothetical protein